MDRLQTMNIFLAVVDAGGFASAARKVDVAPSVVTRAVSELEARLGVRLLTRTTRAVRVTEAGARYAADCRRILGDISEADDAAAGAHAQPRGLLTVTASVLFGSMYVTPLVMSYMAQYPQTTVNCLFLDRVVNRVDEGIDVAVRIGELPDSSLQATQVGKVRRVVCASPDYLSRCGIPKTPPELVEHTIISAAGITPSSEWRFQDGSSVLPVKVRPRMVTTTNDSAIAAALAGFGLATCLSYQVAHHLREGRLQRILAEHEPAALPVHLVHREGRYASSKVRAFLDLARDALRADDSLS